jgi:lysyl-tRNA synthetase class 1
MEKKYEFWTDKLAREIVERKKFRFIDEEIPKFKKFVVKTAASVSGVLHIGRLSDTIRSEAVYLSLKDAGFDAELIWVADNVDPLRKIPKGVPESYKEFLGVPVTEVPDPFGCHKSYEEHFKSEYLEVVNRFIRSDMKIFSMREEYLKGNFRNEIKTILENYETIVEIQNRNRPKDRPLPKDWSPWQPVCKNCGKIITPRVTKIENGKVYYVCKDYAFKTTVAKGCGYEGEDNPLHGNGKLMYKSELASQWYHWQVCSEGFGKEYIVPGSAFWINAEIVERVFRFPMPVPIFYEHLVVDGKKMSASIGNVVYPSDWMKVATPELLRLLFLKDPMRVRDFRWSDIPRLMEEYERLEETYYGRRSVKNEREKANLTRLFELVTLESLPKEKPFRISFDFACILVQIVPKEKRVEKVIEILRKTQHIEELSEKEKLLLEKTLEKAESWVNLYAPENMKIKVLEYVPEEVKKKLSEEQKTALRELGEFLKEDRKDEEIKEEIAKISERVKIPYSKIFEAAYTVLIGKPFGPRLIPFIQSLDKNFVVKRFIELK